jgi:zinc-binding alcohol dehydrogenase/oxidoreductase
MKAIRLHEVGGPHNLRVDEVKQPSPREGELAVRIRAAALNHRDVFITQGLYRNIVLPCILGADGAGNVDDKAVLIDPTIGWGEDDRVWRTDATILGMPLAGTFAEYVCVPSENVYPVPEHLSYEEAAALPLGGVTAFRAICARGELQTGETVLITGIGGGVQTFALLYAKALGARAVVTSGSDEKLEKAKQLGADIGVNYRTDPQWHKTARKLAGSIDMVIDSAGGDSFANALSILRSGGRAVTYGGTTGDARLKMFPIFWNQLDIRGTSMGSPTDFAKMLHFVKKHRIKPVIDRVYDMSEVVQAAQRMSDAQQFGKIVLKIA